MIAQGDKNFIQLLIGTGNPDLLRKKIVDQAQEYQEDRNFISDRRFTGSS